MRQALLERSTQTLCLTPRSSAPEAVCSCRVPSHYLPINRSKFSLVLIVSHSSEFSGSGWYDSGPTNSERPQAVWLPPYLQGCSVDAARGLGFKTVRREPRSYLSLRALYDCYGRGGRERTYLGNGWRARPRTRSLFSVLDLLGCKFPLKIAKQVEGPSSLAF
jgi:hypothetical protein